MGGFPKLGVPFWGAHIIRTIVYWGLYWGTLILGNYHIKDYTKLQAGPLWPLLRVPLYEDEY